jgi:hypothetical protein
MNATLVTVDGTGTETRYLASVRNRGAGTRAAHPHNLHVSIAGDRPWRGWTSIPLNTRTVHSQVAGNALNLVLLCYVQTTLTSSNFLPQQ